MLFMLMLLFMLHVHVGAFFQKCRQVAQLAGSVLSVAAALLVRSASLSVRGQRRPEAAYPQRLAQRAAPGKLQLHVLADCHVDNQLSQVRSIKKHNRPQHGP